MPIYTTKDGEYDIPDDKAEAFEKQFPDAMVSYSNGNDRYDIPVNKKSRFLSNFPGAKPFYDGEDKITGFIPALKQGADALYQGGKSTTGEMTNLLVTGSNRDYLKAQEQLKEMQDSGYGFNDFDPERALKDFKNRKYEKDFAEWKQTRAERRKEREGMGLIDSFKHWWDDPEMPVIPSDRSAVAYSNYKVGDEVQLGRAFNAIQEVLKETNGDVEKAYELLGEKSTKESWGDKTSREVREAMKGYKETKGFSAWVGGMVPQMAGNVAALAVSTNPYTRFLARPLASANMAALSASSAGSAMADARNYAEERGIDVSEGDVVRSGALSGAIEWGTEKIPYERYFGRANSRARRKLGKEVTEAIAGNPNAKRELSSIIKDAARDLPGKLFSKANGKRLVGDVLTEGFSEFLAEGGGSLVPMIYAHPEDYPTLTEILQSGWEGAKGGMFMGGILGGGSTTIGHYSNRNRRKQQGKVILADTGDGVFEVTGQLSEDRYVAVDGDGRTREITREKVNDFQVVDFGEFDNYLKDQTEDNLREAEETGRALAIDVDVARKKQAKQEFDELSRNLSPEQLDDLNAVENPAKYIQEHENEAGVLIPFFNAKVRYDGMIEQIRNDIDDKVQQSIKSIDSNSHPDGNVYLASLKDEDSTPVYIVSKKIVLNEEGMIDRDRSDDWVVVSNNGRLEMQSLKNIEGITAVDNAERMKAITAEKIRQQEATKAAEEIETPDQEAISEEQMYADITVEDYIESTPGLTDYGKESAYNNEEEVIERAKARAKLAIAYRNGELSPREMLVNDVYGYLDEISDERAKEEADNISEYWTERYPQYVVKTKAEVDNDQESLKSGKEQDFPREINARDEFEANIDGIEVTAQVQNVDPDGNATVQFSQPVNVNGETGTVFSLTSEVLQKLILPVHSDVDGQQVAVPERGSVQEPVEKQPVNVQDEEVKMEYPRTKQGEIDYGLIEDSKMYASALKEEFGEDAPGVINDLLSEKESELEKVEKKGNVIERKRAIKKVRDELNALKSVRDIVSPAQKIPETKQVPEGLNEKEYYDWVSKEGDINEVTEAYSQLKEVKNPYSNLHEWQRQILGKKVNADSYYRFGDRNNATRQMKSKWFGKDGKSLDVLAKELSEFGQEVTEQDIVDFITENPSNSISNSSEEVERLGQRFSELASSLSSMKIGRPDSPTGKLFIDLQKAKEAKVSDEALQVMQDKLRKYEQTQPPARTLEESIPEEVDPEGVAVEDIEAYDKYMNLKESTGLIDAQDRNGVLTPSSENKDMNVSGEDQETVSTGNDLNNDNNNLPGDENSLPLQHNKIENEIPESIPQGEHGTVHEEDHRIEETLSELRRRGEENARDAQETGRTLPGREKEIEDRIAEQYAKEKGVWIPMQEVFDLGDQAPSGNENNVYLSSKDNSVYKVNNLMNSGSISSLLERIKLHNQYFPQTKYDLVGFSGFGNRDVFPVLKQDYIENSTFATPEEINNYMQSLGFQQTGRAEYSNNEVVISDLHPRNVLKDSDGDVYVIDAEFREKAISKDIGDQESVVNTNPTEGQKEAGNYKKGHLKLNGFDITIEQPKGSTRSGVDENGKEWSVAMNNTYGYIRGTKGKDGDHIDLFIGPNPESKNVFVVDQVKPDGSFDEHKVMMGFDSIEEARGAYLSNYEEGWQGLGNITGVTLDDFKGWVSSSTRKLKPFSEYKQVQNTLFREMEDTENVNRRFNEELKQQVEGKLPKGHVYQLGKPSKALRSAGIPDLPIELASSRLSDKSMQENHPFELSSVNDLPKAIQNPIAVFDSKMRTGHKTILTELRSDGHNFIVALQMNSHPRGLKSNIEINDIRSIYPKDNVQDLVDWINRGDLLRYVDKNKILNWVTQLQSNVVDLENRGQDSKGVGGTTQSKSNSAKLEVPQNLDVATKILNSFENPTILEGEVSSEIDRMSDELGVKVKKVKDKGELPEGIQRKMKNGRYPGLYDVSTGEVYMVMNEIIDPADAQATMLHEVVGHKGIHGLFGEGLSEFCDKVLDSMNEQDRNKFLEDYDNNRQLAAEEYVASFAEGYKDPNTWERVKAIVKDFFRKMGIDLKVSDNDLKYVLWKAKNGLKNGDFVEDVARKVIQDKEVKKVLFRTAAKTREKMERLEKEIKELKESIRTGRKELKAIVGDVNKFVGETVSVEAGKEMNKSDIDALTKQVNAATTMRDLEIPMMEIERVVNDALLRKGTRGLDNLTRLKVQGRNSKGVSVAKTVDNDTRIVFESIRDTFANLMAKDIDKEIRSLGKEASVLEKELEEKPGDVDLQGRIDELRTRQNELKDEKIELLEKRAADNIKDINARIDEIEGEMDENGELPESARMELSVLNVKRAFSEVSELESELTSIDNEIIGLRKEGSEYWKKGDRVNHKLKKEEVKSKKRARLDVQRSLIEHMKSASGILENIIEGGRFKLKDFNEAQMNRKKEIAREAYDAVRGKRLKGLNEPGSAREREDKSKYGWKDFVKSPFMAPLITMEFMMKHIDKNHRKEKGPLYERFIKGPEGVVEAGNRFYEGLKSFNETANAKIESVFGEKLSKVLKDQSREHEQSGVFVTLTSDSELGKAGAKRELAMSKGRALYTWLVWQMDDGRSKLERDGYSGETIEEIENFIGPKYVKFGKWLQDDYFPRLREEKYNPTHERLFGSSMAAREHYFPFFVFNGDVQEKGELGEVTTGMPSVITGNIINRVRNNSRIDTEKSAFDMMYGYGQKMEEWNAYAEVRQDINGLLKNRYFRNMLDNNGKGLYKQFKLACEVGTRSFREDDSSVVMNKVMSGLNKVVASGAISFKLNTAVKQISSMPAVFEYSMRPEFLVIVGKNLVKSLAGENYRWCMKNLPSFRERVGEKNMGDEKLKGKSLKYLDMYHNAGMWSNRQVDALACAFVAKSVYEYGKKKYLKENSEVEAEFLAKRDAEIAFNTSQQSSRPEFISAMQASSHFGWRFLSTFMNSPFGFHRKMVNGFLKMVADYKPIQERIEAELINKGKSKKEASREAWKQVWADRIDGARQFALYGGVLYATFDIMSMGLLGWTGDDDDDEKNETIRNSFIFGPAMGTPVLGNLMKAISGGHEYNPMMLFGELNDAVSGIRQAANDNGCFSLPVIYEVVREGLSVGTGVDLKTWSNMILGVTGAAKDGIDVTDAMFLLNSPESQRKKIAEQMAKDLTIDEFAKKVSLAYKYLPKDGYWWVPDRKKLTEKRIAEIDKKWNDWQLTPLERAKKKVMDETDKAVKVLDDDPELSKSEQEEKKQELYKEEDEKIKELEKKYSMKAEMAK